MEEVGQESRSDQEAMMKAASEFEVGCVKEVASPTLRAGVSVSKRSVLAMKMEAQESKSELTDNIE